MEVDPLLYLWCRCCVISRKLSCSALLLRWPLSVAVGGLVGSISGVGVVLLPSLCLGGFPLSSLGDLEGNLLDTVCGDVLPIVGVYPAAACLLVPALLLLC